MSNPSGNNAKPGDAEDVGTASTDNPMEPRAEVSLTNSGTDVLRAGPSSGERPDATDIDDSQLGHVSQLATSTTQQVSSRKEGPSPREQMRAPTNVPSSKPTPSKFPQQPSTDWMAWFQDQLGAFAQAKETPPGWMLQAFYSSVGTAATAQQQRDQVLRKHHDGWLLLMIRLRLTQLHCHTSSYSTAAGRGMWEFFHPKLIVESRVRMPHTGGAVSLKTLRF